MQHQVKFITSEGHQIGFVHIEDSLEELVGKIKMVLAHGGSLESKIGDGGVRIIPASFLRNIIIDIEPMTEA